MKGERTTEHHHDRRSRRSSWWILVGLSCLLVLSHLSHLIYTDAIRSSLYNERVSVQVKAQRLEILDKCKDIRTPAGPPPGFSRRTQSGRFVPGTKPVLLKNAKIWTGERNGAEVIYGDIFLENGLIRAFGYIPQRLLDSAGTELELRDVHNAWVTPGLVDLHSHMGVSSLPNLAGAVDGNSRKAPILPWLRSIDGLNTHDTSYNLSIAGGVTTAQILPGSANAIGGQAFVIKLRATNERTTTSKVVEPPYTLNGTNFDHALTPRWRHMKHACGENPSRVYSQTRMDTAWEFRNAYNEATKVKEAQDEFCAKAEGGLWGEVDVEKFPEDLKWEALVDVLRGKVKLSVHCYEAVDLDAIVRLSNEFHFPVASFHHAGETYLVPELLKRTWGGAPAIALFASNFRKKRESFRMSEFAPRVLSEHNIPVVMKSDHPVLNSRYLMYEAAYVHYFGLNPGLAIASVTSTPAVAAGMDHRIGFVREGYDADIVVWDSHPLSLGAAPKQVYIDGIPQIEKPFVSPKPPALQDVPDVPNFDREAKETVEYEGLPPLEPRTRRHVVFTGVKSMYVRELIKRDNGEEEVIIRKKFHESDPKLYNSIFIRDGAIECAQTETGCITLALSHFPEIEIIDLAGGSLAPGLTTFGGPGFGLQEIKLEPSTGDAVVFDALKTKVPAILGGDEAIVKAKDGLLFGTRNALLAYRSGVSHAVTAPMGNGLISGISAAFSTGALNGLEKGAIIQDEVALHVKVSQRSSVSVSTQVAALRKLLFDHSTTHAEAVKKVKKGDMTLVVYAESADIMATILSLKREYEHVSGQELRMTFVAASEAPLLAREIAEAGVSVVTLARQFPAHWDQRRIVPGPPLSNETAITELMKHGVNVALQVFDEPTARNTRFDAAWAALESSGRIDDAKALALVTVNLEKALGVKSRYLDDVVVYRGGGVLDMTSKVVGVFSAARRVVDVF